MLCSGGAWDLLLLTDDRLRKPVSRLQCTSETHKMDMLLDVNTEIYPLEESDRFKMALAYTLSLNGQASAADDAFDQSGAPSLANSFEYVMHGRVFKYLVEESAVRICISFGGLLMELKGDAKNVSSIEADRYIYLLIKKY